jgi:hypothetical protein
MARADGVYLGASVRPGQEPVAPGVSCQTRGGSGSWSLARMARWVVVSSVRCRKVPAGPAKVPRPYLAPPGVGAGQAGAAAWRGWTPQRTPL